MTHLRTPPNGRREGPLGGLPESSALATEPLLIGVPRLVQLLGLSRTRTYALVKRGALPSIRLSERSIVVSRLALEAWLRGEGV